MRVLGFQWDDNVKHCTKLHSGGTDVLMLFIFVELAKRTNSILHQAHNYTSRLFLDR